MTQNPFNLGNQSRKHITATVEHELRYWTKQLGVSRLTLLAAVAEVGGSVEKVRAYLAVRVPER